jgi:hypothetical protein
MANTEELVSVEAARAYSPEIWLDLLAPDRMSRQLRSGRATTARKPRLRLRVPRAVLSLRSLLRQ